MSARLESYQLELRTLTMGDLVVKVASLAFARERLREDGNEAPATRELDDMINVTRGEIDKRFEALRTATIPRMKR